MDAFGIWIQANWFSFLQGVAIVCGLFFTALASIREARSRHIANILSLSGLHRELWAEVHRRPDLQRIVQETADLVQHPISLAEEEFLNLVLVHFYTGWQLARLGTGVSMDVLQKDVQSFFARPIPRAIWQKTKGERDVRFVRFIEKCLVTQSSG